MEIVWTRCQLLHMQMCFRVSCRSPTGGFLCRISSCLFSVPWPDIRAFLFLDCFLFFFFPRERECQIVSSVPKRPS